MALGLFPFAESLNICKMVELCSVETLFLFKNGKGLFHKQLSFLAPAYLRHLFFLMNLMGSSGSVPQHRWRKPYLLLWSLQNSKPCNVTSHGSQSVTHTHRMLKLDQVIQVKAGGEFILEARRCSNISCWERQCRGTSRAYCPQSSWYWLHCLIFAGRDAVVPGLAWEDGFGCGSH